MTNIVFDPLTKTPSILASNRIKRADETGVNSGKPVSPAPAASAASDVCRFCKGNESTTPASVYQDTDDWNVRVFPNKYPIVPNHDIIVHSPQHALDIEDLPQEQNVRIVRAFLNRVFYYYSLNKEVMIFNNRGGRAGASLLHPHSQLIALDGFPGIIERERQGALEYFNQHNECYWCDLVNTELSLKNRVVYESPHFVVLVPQAARWSYELIMLPKSHKPNFGLIDEVEINDFAKVLKSVLIGYNVLFEKPARNFWIHTQRYDPFHWHVGLIPNLKVLGGIELGAGIWVSDRASAEDAAAQLGPVVKKAYESE